MPLHYHLLFSSVAIALASALFAALFRYNKNFGQARVFLVSTVLLAILLPLHNVQIELPTWPTNTTTAPVQLPAVATIAPELPPATPTEKNIAWSSYLLYAYYAVAGLLLLRLVVHALLLLVVYATAQKQQREKYTLVVNTYFRANFTFFRWVFVHREQLNDSNLETILAHEGTHAKQLHTADLLLAELSIVLLWFNPLAWRFKKTIELVHEYLADEGALSTGVDRFEYQALLINQVAEERLIRLSSNFNHSLIKKRMIMITKKENFRSSKLQNLVLIPLATLLFVVTAGLNSSLAQEKEKEVKVIKIYKKTNKNVVIVDDKDGKKVKVIEVTDSGDEDVIFIEQDGEEGNIEIEKFEILLDEENDSTLHKIVKKESTYLIKQIKDGGKKENIWVSSKGNNTKVKVEIRQLKDKDEAHVLHFDKNSKTEIISDGDLKKTLLIVDGKKKKSATEINDINPDNIAEMQIITKKKAIKKYTKEDYESVILVTTRKDEK